MNYKMIGRFIAQIIAIEMAFMVPAMAISLGYGEHRTVFAFLYTLGIMAVLAGGLYLLCRKTDKVFRAREGLVCVGSSWIVLSLLGCLPFVFSGTITNYIYALFEIVSGFTTTGASVLSDVESIPRGILYWRSFSHWLGGMGVLVFLLAISSGSEQGKGFTMHLLRAESPGPEVGKLVPKMKQTATILYLIYITMTVANVIFLLCGNMHWLDALCTAFGTAGTGGFGVRNDSMASFSPYIQNVTTVFMFLFGVNFSCYYLLLLRQIKGVLKDEELRLYVGLFIAAVVLITWNIFPIYGNLSDSIRHSAFQVSSIMTTSGFTTADFDLWPTFSKGLILMLMLIGASAGSTGGGLKVARLLLLFKILRRNIRQFLNPQKVQVIRNNGRVVDEKVLANTNAYFAAYVIIMVLSFVAISLDGFSVETNISAVISCFNNIGPGMAAVGPMCNFSCYSPISILILTADMLAGRLEIFPILILLSKSTWTRK